MKTYLAATWRVLLGCAIGALTFSALIANTAWGQVSTVAPQVLAKVRELGPVLNAQVIDSARDLYVPLQPKPGPDVVVTEDLAYGPDERHRLDVFAPAAKPSRLAPVVVFVHGGGYVGGAKSIPNTPFNGHIGRFFAKRGIVGVVITYRLAPKHPWPAGAEDVGAALRWVHANIAQYSGDPERLFIFGHSAGATHVADYLFQPRFQPQGSDGLVGAILMSGIFDPAAGPQGPNVEAYYGKDRALYAERASVRFVDRRKLPVYIVMAEYDPIVFQAESLRMFEALCQRDGICPRLKQVTGHNHITENYHLGTDDTSLGPDLLGFVNSPR